MVVLVKNTLNILNDSISQKHVKHIKRCIQTEY
jgi:hypothetical protein